VSSFQNPPTSRKLPSIKISAKTSSLILKKMQKIIGAEKPFRVTNVDNNLQCAVNFFKTEISAKLRAGLR
jgi:hypothetical protein